MPGYNQKYIILFWFDNRAGSIGLPSTVYRLVCWLADGIKHWSTEAGSRYIVTFDVLPPRCFLRSRLHSPAVPPCSKLPGARLLRILGSASLRPMINKHKKTVTVTDFTFRFDSCDIWHTVAYSIHITYVTCLSLSVTLSSLSVYHSISLPVCMSVWNNDFIIELLDSYYDEWF